MTEMNEKQAELLDAALNHVVFDGWSDATIKAACADLGWDIAEAKRLYPRGAVDLAAAYHKAGDAAMIEALTASDLASLRYSERVALGVKMRLEITTDKDIVRNGMTLFASPPHMAEGSKLLWGTADAIWTALGDTSDDLNWYSKRTVLSAVYSSVLLFWLGDESENHGDSWAFLDRRIENVMQFEKAKAAVKGNSFAKAILDGPLRFLDRIKAPSDDGPNDLPGQWRL